MTYCPKCRQEFAEGVDTCTECGVDLVENPPPDTNEEIDDLDWVELHTFPGVLYARMAVDMLHKEGVPAYSLSGSNAAVSDNSVDFASSTAIVYALEGYYDQAYELIEPMIEEIPGIFSDEFTPEYEDY